MPYKKLQKDNKHNINKVKPNPHTLMKTLLKITALYTIITLPLLILATYNLINPLPIPIIRILILVYCLAYATPALLLHKLLLEKLHIQIVYENA